MMDAQLSETLVNALNHFLSQGMKLPLIVCSVSPNGSVVVARMRGGGRVEMLAEHYEPNGFQLPMTITVIDETNACGMVTLDAGGKTVLQFISSPCATAKG